MTGPLTEEEMTLERRIEELTNEYENDYGKFQEWAQGDMTLTVGMEFVFEFLRQPEYMSYSGRGMMKMYNTWCLAKACEDAKSEG